MESGKYGKYTGPLATSSASFSFLYPVLLASIPHNNYATLYFVIVLFCTHQPLPLPYNQARTRFSQLFYLLL